MTGYTELQKAAAYAAQDPIKFADESEEMRALHQFHEEVDPATVLALIAENERLSSRVTVLEKYEDECLRLMREAETERDQLKAEVERLKAENQSEVGACLLSVAENKKLQAEIEALRRAMHELANHPKLTASQADILRAAMGKGEQL